MKNYDVAAYIWPSYTKIEPRARQFWEKGIGEWQTVMSAEPRVKGQLLPRKTLWGTVDEADPKIMELEMAKEYSDSFNSVPLITVNSWNEWTEMSYLEPDNVYGYGYLEAVKEVFKA